MLISSAVCRWYNGLSEERQQLHGILATWIETTSECRSNTEMKKKGSFSSEKFNYLGHVTCPGRLELSEVITTAVWVLATPRLRRKLRFFFCHSIGFCRCVSSSSWVPKLFTKKLQNFQPKTFSHHALGRGGRNRKPQHTNDERTKTSNSTCSRSLYSQQHYLWPPSRTCTVTATERQEHTMNWTMVSYTYLRWSETGNYPQGLDGCKTGSVLPAAKPEVQPLYYLQLAKDFGMVASFS